MIGRHLVLSYVHQMDWVVGGLLQWLCHIDSAVNIVLIFIIIIFIIIVVIFSHPQV